MLKLKLLMSVLGVAIVTMGCAQKSDYLTNEDKVAISGYDVVSYFKAYKAERGSKKYSTVYDGVTFYFSNEENKKTFTGDPTLYLPQYGGYCAFAMAAKNAKVPSDPETFKIYDGKLYLFFNDYYEGSPFNTIIPWNGDEANMRTKADANWKAMN